MTISPAEVMVRQLLRQAGVCITSHTNSTATVGLVVSGRNSHLFVTSGRASDIARLLDHTPEVEGSNRAHPTGRRRAHVAGPSFLAPVDTLTSR